MAVEVASLKAVLDLDKRGLDTGLKSASNSLSGFGGSIKGVVGALGAIGAGVAVFSGVTDAITGMVNAARESVAAGKQLDAVIKSTGGAAGVTAQMAKDLASSLQDVTNFGDEAILSGESMLLTFTRIGKDVFPRATETMLDMSQALGQDLKSSAIQLGKALNDPVKGMTALSRVGVAFTGQQKALVKEMMSVGDLAGAQKIILDELATEFGGSARALADPFIQLQNALGEIQETLGMGLLPILNEAAQAVLPALREAATAVGPSLGELGKALGKAFGENLADIIGMMVELAASFGTFLDGLSKLGIALGMGGESASEFNLMLLPLKITFTILGTILSTLGRAFEAIAFVIKAVSHAFGGVNETTRQAQINAQGVATFWNALATAGQFLWTWIQNIITGWRQLIAVMSTSISMPNWLWPTHSPPPLALAFMDLSKAIKSIPPLPSFGGVGMGGMTPIASGGGSSSTINITVGNVSASTTTNGDAPTEALRMTIQMLRQQLDR